MRTAIQIPALQRYKRTSHKTQRQIVEKVSLREAAGDDMAWMAPRVNLTYILADIQQMLMMEVEEKIKEKDADLSLDMRNSIERIKAHAGNLVSFVDKHATEEYAIGFGEKADEIRELLFKMFKIEP